MTAPAPPEKHRFKKGQSGNPGGRKKGLGEFRTLCANLSTEHIPVLVRILKSKARFTKNADKIRAWEVLAAYGWGKPAQTVDVTNSDGTLTQAWAAAATAMQAEDEEATVTH